MKYTYPLLIFLWPIINLFGVDPELDPSPIAVFNSAPSAIISNVNTITGTYQEISQDTVIPGPEPLVIQRSYCSINSGKGFLKNGWNINHGGFFILDRNKKSQSRLYDSTGSLCVMTCPHSPKDKDSATLWLDMDMMSDGFTNCSEGRISGRTNKKNYSIICNDRKKLCWLHMGSGNIRYYEPGTDDLEGKYYLRNEKKANGNIITYHYDNKNRLHEINTKNAKGSIFAWAKFKWTPSKDFDRNPQMILHTSDGREVIYHFFGAQKKNFEGEKKIHYYLDSIQRPNAPTEKYEYLIEKDAKTVIKRKVLPDKRYLNIEYFSEGSQRAGHKWINVERESGIFRRVKSMQAPVGTDASPITTHRFEYDLEHNITKVYDALHRLTIYKYSDNSILTSIKKPFKNLLNRYENFYWGEDSKQGYLISRTLSTSGPQHLKRGIIGCKSYEYDNKGNVTCESIWGNLTGKGCPPVNLDDKTHYPINNGCEHYDIHYQYSNDEFNLVIKETYPNGKVVNYGYKPKTDLMTSKLVSDNKRIILREFHSYNSDAVLIETIRDDGSTEDRNNLKDVKERYITRIYPKSEAPCIGLPEKIEEKYLDSSGKEILIKITKNQYDNFGNLCQQEHYNKDNQLAYTLYWKYNTFGQVIWEKDALGQTIEREFDLNGNKRFEKGPRPDDCKNFTYDFSNRLIREEEVDSNGIRLGKTYHYDYVGNCKGSTDYLGNETRYIYDDFNKVVRTTSPQVVTDSGLRRSTIEYDYDILGNCIETKDARGFKTIKKYNLRGQPTEISYPDGSIERFEYTLAGKIAKQTDRKNLTTTYTYDVLDRVIKIEQLIENKLLTTKECIYSTFHLIEEIDELKQKTHYKYNAAGCLIEKQIHDQKTTYTYDSLGRQNQEIQWLSSSEYLAKNQTYDNLNRIVDESLTDQTGTIYNRTNYTYHPDGQPLTVTSYGQGGTCTTTTHYNTHKQPTLIVDAEGNQTFYTYNYGFINHLGQRVLQSIMTDSRGYNTIILFDTMNRPVAIYKQDPMGMEIQRKEMFYDISGNNTKTAETVFYENKGERLVWTLATYDWMNRLEHLIDNAHTSEEKRTAYSYNSYGQKDSLTKADGHQIKYTYNALGQLIQFKANDDSFDYMYTYNAKGLLTKAKDVKDGSRTRRSYNSNEKLVLERLQNGLEISYEYDKIGRPTKIILPNQSSIIYHYQGPYLKKIFRYNESGKELYQHTYIERDLSGNPTIEELALKGQFFHHTYDRLGRLKSAITEPWQENNLTYSGVDQLLSRDINDAKGFSHCEYTYDSLDQLKEETGSHNHTYRFDSTYNQRNRDNQEDLIDNAHKLLSHGNISYKYDLNGNRIHKLQKGYTTEYKYDALDRLIAVIDEGKKTTYTYDAFNRRITKSTGEEIYQYLYVDQNEIGSVVNHELKELRILGTGKGAEIGATVAMEIDKELYIPLHDHNGHVACLLDKDGIVNEVYRYSAFGIRDVYDRYGNVVEKSINPWCFSSKRYDSETGWIYFGRRYYDPETSRWTTPDPIGKEGGPNLYTYVVNNPLTHIDLYGLADFSGFIRGLFMQICGMIGNVLSQFGYECIPVPVAKDVLTLPGHVLQGKDVNEYVPSWNERHSYNGSIGEWQDIKYADIHVNGIRTSDEDVKTRYKNSSNICNENKNYYTYNAMHGGCADLLEWSAQRLGVPTNSVDKLVLNIRERIRDLGGIDSGGRIRLWAHSQGGEIVANIRRYLSPEEMRMIDVKTYGTANIFHKGDFGSVTHYVSTRDWVPLMSNPIQYALAKFGMHPEVQFLNAIDSPYFDHSFEGKTYQTQYYKDTCGIR